MAGSIAITDRGGVTDDLTTYTISGAAIGDAAADRAVLVELSWRQGDVAARTLVSATIGGDADILAQPSPAIGNHGAAIIGLEVPSGTTADIVFTFDDANSRLVYAVARAVGIDYGAGPIAVVQQSLVSNGSSVTRAMNINTVDGGVVFAGIGGGTLGTLTLSYGGTDGLTADTQQSAEVCRGLAGTADIVTGQTPRDIDAVYTTASEIFGAAEVAVSFGPSVGGGFIPYPRPRGMDGGMTGGMH